MMQKIIFLDIDGTLVNEKGMIPESAKLAVRKARENGHIIYLCTGRSRGEIFDDILSVGFDGLIGGAGCYIEVEKQALFHEKFKKTDAQQILDFFYQKGIDFYLETNTGLFASENCKQNVFGFIEKLKTNNPDFLKEIEKGIVPFYEALIEGEELIREDINKIVFLDSAIPIDSVMQEFEARYTVIPSTFPVFGSNSGEISLLGINKATAIEKVLARLNITKENAFAYGDSFNDIEMLQFVQHGIAMGNAHEIVKSVADDVTEAVDENGIYNSFEKYGLIG
ncbi:HAD family hydrolase [Niallia taxi]|uniref:HAD family hydrolase n=1 Tax=Niallia taxi TaxID=2499688 RepID=UPI00300BE066